MPKLSIFPQIIKLIPRTVFESAVARHDGDKGVRTLDCWSWFGSLMFSQLSGHDSIRALERVFAIGNKEMLSLGFSPVRRSTLSDANAVRSVGILEDIFKYCVELTQKRSLKHLPKIGMPVLLLDSTFIKLCLSLCPWAYYRRSDKKTGNTKYAGVKLHTAIDLTGHIPEFVVIKAGTEATNGDLRVARENFKFTPNSLVVFDRGYWSAEYFNELNKNKTFFVTRPKNKKIKFKVERSRPSNRTLGIICDQDIYLNGPGTKGKYQGKLRRISYFDEETKKRLVFITNKFDVSAQVICDLYKSRWDVELFFKTLKQNLKIKKFLGLSPNAVTAQIYTALISYVLLTYLKMIACSGISMPELMAVVSTLLLLKHNIIELLQNQPKTRRHPPPDPQLKLLLIA